MLPFYQSRLKLYLCFAPCLKKIVAVVLQYNRKTKVFFLHNYGFKRWCLASLLVENLKSGHQDFLYQYLFLCVNVSSVDSHSKVINLRIIYVPCGHVRKLNPNLNCEWGALFFIYDDQSLSFSLGTHLFCWDFTMILYWRSYLPFITKCIHHFCHYF